MYYIYIQISIFLMLQLSHFVTKTFIEIFYIQDSA